MTHKKKKPTKWSLKMPAKHFIFHIAQCVFCEKYVDVHSNNKYLQLCRFTATLKKTKNNENDGILEIFGY